MIFLIYFIFIHHIWEKNFRDLLRIKKGRSDRQSSDKFFKTFSIASPLFFIHEFRVGSVSEHILHGRTGLMGAVARFLGGPGVVSPPATDSAGSVYVYAHTQESRSSALAGAMLGELALSRSRSRRSYMLAEN